MKHIDRIKETFAKGKVFVAYLTAGDGGIERSLAAAFALIAGGVNMLEIGVPFSDPIADGPVIQRASTRALKAQTTLQEILWLTQEIRKKSDIPLILFSYYNPILSAMKSTFVRDAKLSGLDGILIVDCPIEEMQAFHNECLSQQIAPIYIIATSTPLERIKKIDKFGRGFLYYACRKGTTGLRESLPKDFVQKMKMIKSAVHLPVVAGFGISQRQMAEEVLRYADGFVVGSLFVKAMEEGATSSELTSLANSIRPEEVIL